MTSGVRFTDNTQSFTPHQRSEASFLLVELFGQTFESPLLIAPVGVQTIFHHDKETGMAEIASQIGLPYILSTAASSSIEEVAKANGDGARWFQLYWPQDNEITKSVSISPSHMHHVPSHYFEKLQAH